MRTPLVICGERSFRSRAWLALMAAPLVLAGALALAWLITRTSFAVFCFHLVALGLVGLTWAWRRNPGRRWEGARIEVREAGLRVGGELVRREDVKDALVEPQSGRSPVVRISRRGAPDLELRVPDQDSARALLLALGKDVSQTTATFRAGSLALSGWMRFLPPAVAVPAFVLSSLLGAAAPVVVAIVASLLALLYLWPTRVVVGADGVLVRWHLVRRFFAVKDIVTAHPYEESFGRNRTRGVEIALRDGSTMRIPVSSPAWDGGRTELIAARIGQAVAHAQRGGTAAETALALGRAGEPASQWIARLRAIGTGANAQLRVAPVDPERLWRVVEDPRQPTIARAAAAVALGPTLEGEGKERLARVAEATAKPELRVALEAVTEDAEDARLEEVLAALEER